MRPLCVPLPRAGQVVLPGAPAPAGRYWVRCIWPSRVVLNRRGASGVPAGVVRDPAAYEPLSPPECWFGGTGFRGTETVAVCRVWAPPCRKIDLDRRPREVQALSITLSHDCPLQERRRAGCTARSSGPPWSWPPSGAGRLVRAARADTAAAGVVPHPPGGCAVGGVRAACPRAAQRRQRTCGRSDGE